MSLILFAHNLLELGTVTAAAAAAFPKERLYDRDRGPQWQADAVAQRDIDVDLGAGVSLSASAWALVNHNLTVAVEIRTSSDGVTFGTLVDSATPAGVDPFLRTFTLATSRYWRIRIPAGASAASIGELLLGVPVTLPTEPTEIAETVEGNVRRDESPAGFAWRVKRGAPRRRVEFSWDMLPESDYAELLEAFADTEDGAKALLVQDPSGVLRWMEFAAPRIRSAVRVRDWRGTAVSFLEAL